VALDRPAPFGRYRVNLDAIAAVGVPALLDALHQGQVIVVDEVGPMEILSPRFRDAILRILDSKAAVVGAIVLRPQPFADRVKAHPRVKVVYIARDNRDDLPTQILSELGYRGPVRRQGDREDR
jgi:nucleoside-triphosphatase